MRGKAKRSKMRKENEDHCSHVSSLAGCGLHCSELYTVLVDKVNNYFRRLNLEATVSQ